MLRYLADAYRALRSACRTPRAPRRSTDIIEWLGELVRQVDSSLLDEWEQLTAPGAARRSPVVEADRPSGR